MVKDAEKVVRLEPMTNATVIRNAPTLRRFNSRNRTRGIDASRNSRLKRSLTAVLVSRVMYGQSILH